MEDRETARMRKYRESKTTRIMMTTVPHVTSGLGLKKISGRWIFVDTSVRRFSYKVRVILTRLSFSRQILVLLPATQHKIRAVGTDGPTDQDTRELAVAFYFANASIHNTLRYPGHFCLVALRAYAP